MSLRKWNFTLAVITVLGAVSSAAAATNPSWSSSQPSWANSDGDNRPQASRRIQAPDTRYNISPFAPGSHNIALDVGQVFLMGDLSKYSDAIGAQMHYTYGVSDLFGFDTSFGYSNHDNFSMTSLLAGLRTNLSWYDKVVPYMVFGLGFYRPSYTFASGAESSTTLAPVLFGVHVGPGVDLELTKQLFFGASLTFHDAFGTTKTKPDGSLFDVGGTFTSFLLHAGMTF